MSELNQNGLTTLEHRTLKLIIHRLYAEADFSDVVAEDLQKPLELDNKRSLSGVISSLSKKGYIKIEDYNEGHGKFEFIHLSEAGMRFHPDHSKERGITYEELA